MSQTLVRPTDAELTDIEQDLASVRDGLRSFEQDEAVAEDEEQLRQETDARLRAQHNSALVTCVRGCQATETHRLDKERKAM
jgi:hypothetical protein